MYRCTICQAVSQPGKPRLTHCIHRPNGNIHRELAVCTRCQFQLASGTPLEDLVVMAKHSQARKQVIAQRVKEAQQTAEVAPPISAPDATRGAKLIDFKTKPARLVGHEL